MSKGRFFNLRFFKGFGFACLILFLLIPVAAKADGGPDIDTFYELTTIKYDTEGNEKWVATHDTDYAQSNPVAVGVDAMGNVIITGTIYPWCITIQYDANGTQRWMAEYKGLNNIGAHPVALAVDSQANVYIAGYSLKVKDYYTYDLATVKYDTDGMELWTAGYVGQSNEESWANDIAVDLEGHVYVTGISETSEDIFDFITFKYDSDGNELWHAAYGQSSEDEKAYAVALDHSGNVVVSGVSYQGWHAYFTTVKYDSEGNHVWTANYDATNDYNCNHFNLGAMDVATDSLDNVFVTGNTGCGESSSETDYATVKYDSDGNQLWAAAFDGTYTDSAKFLVIDPWDNAVVTGWSQSEVQGDEGYDFDDIVTIKYDPEGHEIWQARYDELTANYPNDLSVDSQGNVYIAGNSCYFDNHLDLFNCYFLTIKVDKDGTELWAVEYRGSNSEGGRAASVAVDDSGNVYVTGTSFRYEEVYDDDDYYDDDTYDGSDDGYNKSPDPIEDDDGEKDDGDEEQNDGCGARVHTL